MPKTGIHPIIPKFDREIETLSGALIEVTETSSEMFTEIWVSNSPYRSHKAEVVRLTDEEVVLLRDTLTQLLRTRRRRK